MEQINKSFPGVHALDEVNFQVYPGEIVALVGENGAGKSTLMKILIGVYRKDQGKMSLNGTEIEPLTPHEAFMLGISVIHQELNLVPEMMVFENVFLGRETRRRSPTGKLLRRLNKMEMRQETKRLLGQLGANFEPDTVVKELGVAQQQMVEIAKALSFDARIIIMDEPTSSLPQSDVETLFKVVRGLKQHGVSIVFITHRLEEVFEIADRVVVLRDGKNTGQLPIEEATIEKVITFMVGRTMDQMFPKQEVKIGEVVLSAKGLSRGKKVRDVSFELCKGEILGFAGLVGAGRTETARALFGIDKKDAGEVWLEGQMVDLISPQASIRAGLGFVPEDRKLQGLILGMAVYQNVTLASLKQITRTLVINRTAEQTVTKRFVDQLRIRTPSIRQLVKHLSGGNQQKVVLAKWLALQPKVLILDEPTRGIDVGAKAEIHALISQFAQEGMGVILISSELPELLGMCDRILVMSKGTITGEFTQEEADQEKIMASAVVNVK
jgi:ABC-type sugar transport system ATPase subunit